MSGVDQRTFGEELAGSSLRIGYNLNISRVLPVTLFYQE
jgi:hypothetical protein